MNQTEDEEDEDVGLPPELEKIVTHENQEMGPHQEETELAYISEKVAGALHNPNDILL